MQYGWALEFPNSNVCSTIWPRNFLITKKFSANNSSIDLLKSNSHGPSMNCILYLWFTVYHLYEFPALSEWLFVWLLLTWVAEKEADLLTLELVDWLIGWLVGWLFRRIGLLVDWLTNWYVLFSMTLSSWEFWLADWLTGWLICLTVWSIGHDRLIDWLTKLHGWPLDCFISWLIWAFDWLTVWLVRSIGSSSDCPQSKETEHFLKYLAPPSHFVLNFDLPPPQKVQPTHS